MSVIEIASSAIAVLAVTTIAWRYSQQRRRHRLTDAHRELIQNALDTITRETARKRDDSTATPNSDILSTFVQLHALIEEQSGEVRSDARKMQRLWIELDGLFDETSQDNTSATTRAAILASRAATLADLIDGLAADILTELV